ncbi:hypothetical protein TWF225_012082 [Orbilia oligospora]|nr:hypothetical protein TWF225_012082 [Orbilia oligospora]KAF3266541.1 hypothetical protein TWF128_012104 [Orbilia oligospora]KAF3272133.1 hypothetical protein TWF217_012077 [Orbilia oligospora]KAF3297698.1 hypothetical protein TWF132_012100 [Orbilia oligospora]
MFQFSHTDIPEYKEYNVMIDCHVRNRTSPLRPPQDTTKCKYHDAIRPGLIDSSNQGAKHLHVPIPWPAANVAGVRLSMVECCLPVQAAAFNQ